MALHRSDSWFAQIRASRWHSGIESYKPNKLKRVSPLGLVNWFSQPPRLLKSNRLSPHCAVMPIPLSALWASSSELSCDLHGRFVQDRRRVSSPQNTGRACINKMAPSDSGAVQESQPSSPSWLPVQTELNFQKYVKRRW